MEKIRDKQITDSQSQTVSYHPWWSRFLKRALDIIASSLGLIFLSPVFGLLALVIRRTGPIFFRGMRIGKHGKPFKILKFRTMHACPESYTGSRITAQGDDRITPLGAWLRATKLNELPQLWNVLKGEMSLVGPRPEDPAFVEKWLENARSIILSMRPGITSPASISYRNEEKRLHPASEVDDYLLKIAPDKLRLDVLYVQHQSFLSDLDVIFLTLVMLLPRLRETRLPEREYFSGPFSQFVRRYFSWFVIDALIVFVSISIIGLLYRLGAPLDLGWGVSFILAVGMSFMFSLFNNLIGLDRISWRHANPLFVLRLILSGGLVVSGLSLINKIDTPIPELPLGLIWVAGVLSLTIMIIFRYRERLLTGLASRWLGMRGKATRAMGEQALIVGAGEQAQLISWLLTRGESSIPISIVGMVDDDLEKVGLRIGEYRVLGSIPEIPRIVEKKDIGLIFYAINNASPVDRKRILNICRATPARVIVVPDLIKIFHDELVDKEVQTG